MELIPVKIQPECESRLCVLQTKLKAVKYLLDENTIMTDEEKQSGEYVHVKDVLRPGIYDKWVLDYAIENNLKIITYDTGLVLRALKKNQEIYLEDDWNRRFYFDGRNTQLVKTNRKQPDWKSISNRKKFIKQNILYVRNPTNTLSFL